MYSNHTDPFTSFLGSAAEGLEAAILDLIQHKNDDLKQRDYTHPNAQAKLTSDLSKEFLKTIRVGSCLRLNS